MREQLKIFQVFHAFVRIAEIGGQDFVKND